MGIRSLDIQQGERNLGESLFRAKIQYSGQRDAERVQLTWQEVLRLQALPTRGPLEFCDHRLAAQSEVEGLEAVRRVPTSSVNPRSCSRSRIGAWAYVPERDLRERRHTQPVDASNEIL